MYVASEATEENLKHVDSLLRHLGLGYITVNENRAEEIFPPGANTRFNQREFQLQVHAKAALLLAAREVFGKENFQFGRADEPSKVWVSSLEACNISSSYNSEEKNNFWFCLNLEKEAVRRVFNTLNPEDFYNFLSKLPSDYIFWIAKIESYRPKKYVDEQSTSVPDITLSKIRKCIDTMQSWGWQAHIQVRRKTHLDNIAKEKIVSELNKSIADLSSLQEHMSTVLRR